MYDCLTVIQVLTSSNRSMDKQNDIADAPPAFCKRKGLSLKGKALLLVTGSVEIEPGYFKPERPILSEKGWLLSGSENFLVRKHIE